MTTLLSCLLILFIPLQRWAWSSSCYGAIYRLWDLPLCCCCRCAVQLMRVHNCSMLISDFSISRRCRIADRRVYFIKNNYILLCDARHSYRKENYCHIMIAFSKQTVQEWRKTRIRWRQLASWKTRTIPVSGRPSQAIAAKARWHRNRTRSVCAWRRCSRTWWLCRW